jgi:hypothetical protein
MAVCTDAASGQNLRCTREVWWTRVVWEEEGVREDGVREVWCGKRRGKGGVGMVDGSGLLKR